MKGNSRRLRTYAECVSTQPELDVDMDAVAARETVTEIVTETETARERDNAFVAFGLFGVCWWQRQTAKATAQRAKMLQAGSQLQATARCTRHISVAAREQSNLSQGEGVREESRRKVLPTTSTF